MRRSELEKQIQDLKNEIGRELNPDRKQQLQAQKVGLQVQRDRIPVAKLRAENISKKMRDAALKDDGNRRYDLTTDSD